MGFPLEEPGRRLYTPRSSDNSLRDLNRRPWHKFCFKATLYAWNWNAADSEESTVRNGIKTSTLLRVSAFGLVLVQFHQTATERRAILNAAPSEAAMRPKLQA